MRVYRMEDYHICLRIGRAEPTGRYETTRQGRRKAVVKYQESYQTNAGIFRPEEWKEIVLRCVEEAGAGELLERLKEDRRKYCAWLKTEKDIEDYSLDILLGRYYRHWEEFSVEGIEEKTAFVFDFSGEDIA